MSLPEKNPDKADKLWYFAPIFFSILGGLIGYFVWRKPNPKFAKRLLVVGLILIIPHMILTSVFLYDENLTETTTKFQYPSNSENKIQQQDTINQNYFIDTTGYTPEWAKNIGDQQILGKCNNLLMEQNPFKRSDDEKWCNEFGGYFMDYTDKEMEQMMNDLGINLP